jgi:hypothetical protein
MTIISEAGFTASVIEHVKTLHSATATLGLLHPTETGLIERFNATFLGIVGALDLWWFASIIVQYADDGQIDVVPLETIGSYEEKIFGRASPMDLVCWAEAQDGHPSATGIMRTLNFDCSQSLQGTYRNRVLRRIIIVAEKPRRIWEPDLGRGRHQSDARLVLRARHIDRQGMRGGHAGALVQQSLDLRIDRHRLSLSRPRLLRCARQGSRAGRQKAVEHLPRALLKPLVVFAVENPSAIDEQRASHGRPRLSAARQDFED